MNAAQLSSLYNVLIYSVLHLLLCKYSPKKKNTALYRYLLNFSQSLTYLVALPTPILFMIPDCSILPMRFLTCFSVSNPLKVSISVLLLILSWVLKHSLTFCNCCIVTPLIVECIRRLIVNAYLTVCFIQWLCYCEFGHNILANFTF